MYDTQLHHLDFSRHSHEIWEELNKFFGLKGQFNKFIIKKQFFGFKMAGREVDV
jgi:hypothetical protein